MLYVRLEQKVLGVRAPGQTSQNGRCLTIIPGAVIGQWHWRACELGCWQRPQAEVAFSHMHAQEEQRQHLAEHSMQLFFMMLPSLRSSYDKDKIESVSFGFHTKKRYIHRAHSHGLVREIIKEPCTLQDSVLCGY